MKAWIFRIVNRRSPWVAESATWEKRTDARVPEWAAFFWAIRRSKKKWPFRRSVKRFA